MPDDQQPRLQHLIDEDVDHLLADAERDTEVSRRRLVERSVRVEARLGWPTLATVEKWISEGRISLDTHKNGGAAN